MKMQLYITYQMSSKINQIILLSKSSSINSSVLNLFLEPIFVGLSLRVIMFQCIFICILSFDIFNNKFYIIKGMMHGGMGMTGKKIENYVFNYSDFLGSGNFSNCYKARNTKTNEQVAIKIVELNSLKSKKLQQLLFSEIEVLKQMNHPNVLRCFQVFTSNRNCYIITELCNEGDLQNKIKKKQKLEEVEIHSVIADVYKGLKYLGSKNIIHRDLKIANIFVHNGIAKIADFGFALHSKTNFRDFNIGSPLYMAPEGIMQSIYGPKTDVWSFGVMIYQLYHGRTPFGHCQTEQQLKSCVIRQFQRNQFKNQLPNQIKDLIMNCLQVNEEKRLLITQLINNSFLHKIVHNRQIQNNTSLRFKPPVKHKELKIFQMHEEQLRGRSHMKVRSAFAIQDQAVIVNRPMQRAISPNKTFMTAPQSINNFFNNSFNSLSNQNIFQSTQSVNITNMNFNFPHPKINQSITMNDRSLQSLTSVMSPVTFADETLNKNQSTLTNINRKVYLITSEISFKECVSILHYCRLIFKYLTYYKQLTSLNEHSFKEHYATLAQFLIFCLEQIFERVCNKRIRYDGENRQMRQKKLYEVTDEYKSKYNKQLDSQTIKRHLSQRQKSQLSLSVIVHLTETQSSSHWLNEKSSLQQIIVGQLLLVIYSSSVLLEQCMNKKAYSQFQKYKQIQQTLNKSKQAFTFTNYAKYKNRTFGSKLLNPQ